MGDVHLNRLPAFSGDPMKDGLTAEMFVERISNAAEANGWNERQTLAHFQNALRGGAAMWLDSLRSYPRLNLNTWDPDVKQMFLQRYKQHQTSTTAVGLLDGLTQKANEDVLQFADRVALAFRKLALLRPVFDIPAVTAANTNAEYFGNADDTKTVAQNFYGMYSNGANLEFFTIQFFLAGLTKEIQQRVYDQQPQGGFQDFLACRDKAREIEMLAGRKALVDKIPGGVAEVNEEVAAFRGRGRGRGLGNNRGGARGRGTAPSRGRGGSSTTAQNGSGSGTSGTFNGKCFICGKYGHRKNECRSAPKVGEVGENNQDQQQQHQGQDEDDQDQYYEETVETVGLTGFNYRHLN